MERNRRVTFAQPAAVHALKLGKKKGGVWRKMGYWDGGFIGNGQVLFHFWVSVFCVFFPVSLFCLGEWLCVMIHEGVLLTVHRRPSCWILQECSGSATNCMSCYGIAELLPKDGGGQGAICMIWELIWPVVGCWTLWKMQHGFRKSEFRSS